MMDKKNEKLRSCLQLLHLSDPLLPIGGFTHSYGLETYVQKGLVDSGPAAKNYMEVYLKHNFLYNDLLAARLAWEYAGAGDVDGIVELNNVLCASKAPKELRLAGTKLGLRFIKIIENLLKDNSIYIKYSEAIKAGRCESNYCTAFGMAARLFDIGREEALCAVTYGTASAIINNCGKLIPLSQMEGQKILFESGDIMEELIEKVMELKPEHLGMNCVGFDIRSMQHERLYTRIYIS